MPAKTKENYKSEKDKSNPRDNFYTPRYATELLLDFIPSSIDFVWECADGEGSISNILLEQKRYGVHKSDLRDDKKSDFFADEFIPDMFYQMDSCIITNPPFGIKKKFFERALKLGKPFALLIPADYSGWIIEAIDYYGAEKIVPTRRIDYITPLVCDLVYKKELKRFIENDALIKYKKFTDIPEEVLEIYADSVEKHSLWSNIPEELIRKHSSSDFHSMWLTWGFGLGKTETFVDLTLGMKKRIF